jgi:hypothetical protein
MSRWGNPFAPTARASSTTSARCSAARAHPTGPRGGGVLRAGGEPDGAADDKTYAQQLKAAAILEPLFEEQPDHPGARALHHSRLRSSAARRARARRRAALRLDRARRPARAAHAVAHVHARGARGRSRSTPTSRRPRRPNAKVTPRCCTRSTTRCTRTCRSRRTARREGSSTSPRRSLVRAEEQYGLVRRLYAAAAIPARYALERGVGRSRRAEPRTTTPYVDAMTHFARAVGAARSGRCLAAAPVVAAGRAGTRSLIEQQDAYWAAAGGDPAPRRSAGRRSPRAGATRRSRLLRRAADAEDSTDKSAISPGSAGAGARAARRDAARARPAGRGARELEAVMQTEPNRFAASGGRGTRLAPNPIED